MMQFIPYKILPWFLAAACLVAILLCTSRTASSPKILNLSTANPFFVGREKTLKDIKSFFKKGSPIAAITGASGFGKTQTAKYYAQLFQKDYDLIWWIDAQQDMPSQFERLALALNQLLPIKDKIVPSSVSKEVLVDLVKNVLRTQKIKYILVFDNTDNFSKIEKYIPYNHNEQGKHILLTSRYAEIWPDRVAIGQFERQESIAFIQKSLPKTTEEEREELAEGLSDYPLGLTLAVKFIKSAPTTTIKKYLEMHMKRTLKRRDNPPSTALDKYPHTAQGALDISLNHIEENSKEALATLFFMSLLNSKDIPESYIELWLKKTNASLTADEAIKYIYDQSLLGVSETTEFNANKKAEGKERMHYLSIHDLIHQLINEEIPSEEKKLLIDKATDVMLDVFAGASEVFIKKIMHEPIHLLHAQKLCENAKEIDHYTPNLLKLKVCVFESLMGPLRDFENAKAYAEEIEADLKAGVTLEPYYKALFKINKGFFESTSNTAYEKAINYTQEGLSILETLQGYKEEKLRGVTNISQYYCLLGETEKAEEFIANGVSLFKDSKSVAYNALFLFAWSYFFNDRGDFENSLQVLNKANPYSALSTAYPTMEHALLHQKVESLIKLHQLDKAWEVLQDYERKLKEFFHSKNTSSLTSCMLFKSLILIHKNKSIPKAFKVLREAISRYNEFFQGDTKHRRQALAHFALGKAWTLKNELTKALEEYLFSEKIYTEILKEKKIDDVSELYKELVFLGAKLKDEKLIHTYLRAHLKVFGDAHPRTQEMLVHLDKQGIDIPL